MDLGTAFAPIFVSFSPFRAPGKARLSSFSSSLLLWFFLSAPGHLRHTGVPAYTSQSEPESSEAAWRPLPSRLARASFRLPQLPPGLQAQPAAARRLAYAAAHGPFVQGLLKALQKPQKVICRPFTGRVEAFNWPSPTPFGSLLKAF